MRIGDESEHRFSRCMGFIPQKTVEPQPPLALARSFLNHWFVTVSAGEPKLSNFQVHAICRFWTLSRVI